MHTLHSVTAQTCLSDDILMLRTVIGAPPAQSLAVAGVLSPVVACTDVGEL